MDREQQILSLIRRNPFISQKELAEQINISRSAVAGYIASLTRKGSIKGRAYVTSDEGSVICIGGANLDSKATGKQTLRLAASNPVTVTEACGGVARNIAENLAHLGCSVSLLALTGDDKAGHWVLEETARHGVDTSPSVMLRSERTGSYTAVLDQDGEMFLALANMDIYESFTPALLHEKWPHIASTRLVVVDTNLPADCLAYLVERCRAESLPLFIDPISPEKSKKLPDSLQGVTAIFPNLAEARELAYGGKMGTGTEGAVPAEDRSAEAGRLAAAIRERGAGHVFITMGKDGVFYSGSEAESGTQLAAIPTEVVEVTGAGDAFLAGVAYGVLRERNYLEACQLGLAASHLALQTSDSVSDRLTAEELNQTIQQMRGHD
ncbi:carbohydrate kinase [Cohnella sp. AR92]|uniref:carbohydrate kinase n=1 Tax=Cohnella sp. AR92 TaxID=648716 RepID=UPI000F8CEA30|nr:carbohydrate kinase [Cohnella sp. AR92]RUS42881.1 winged helix-turn-helix transcriptional regulator [Cohnella sp. AR92]